MVAEHIEPKNESESPTPRSENWGYAEASTVAPSTSEAKVVRENPMVIVSNTEGIKVEENRIEDKPSE